MSDEKQSNLLNLLGNTTNCDARSRVNTSRVRHGQIPTDKQRSKRNSRRRDLVAYKGGVCERCNASPLYVAFDFHHKDPEQKKFPLSQRNMARKWEDLIKEADKCHLLCANCHRIVHFKRETKFLK